MDIKDILKQTKPFESECIKAYINFIYTAKLLENRNAEMMKPHKITGQHYNILRILKGRYPESASPSDIKEVLIDKKCDLTRLIDKLVKMKYVIRNVNDLNRRKLDIFITKEGLSFLNSIEPDVKNLNPFPNAFTTKEAEQFNALLDKLRDFQ